MWLINHCNFSKVDPAEKCINCFDFIQSCFACKNKVDLEIEVLLFKDFFTEK